jgi:hypothetical protein
MKSLAAWQETHVQPVKLSETHRTTRLLLRALHRILHDGRISEEVFIHGFIASGLPVPSDVSRRKYMRTFRLAGYPVHRKRTGGTVYYVLSHAMRPLPFTQAHEQAWEELGMHFFRHDSLRLKWNAFMQGSTPDFSYGANSSVKADSLARSPQQKTYQKTLSQLRQALKLLNHPALPA